MVPVPDPHRAHGDVAAWLLQVTGLALSMLGQNYTAVLATVSVAVGVYCQLANLQINRGRAAAPRTRG